jgi:hypothetical protein
VIVIVCVPSDAIVCDTFSDGNTGMIGSSSVEQAVKSIEKLNKPHNK